MATDGNSKQAQRLWPRWLIAGSNPIKIDMGLAGSGHVVDISGGGLRVQSLVPLKRGAEIPVRIEIPHKTEPLQCSGIVVWSKANGAAGIRFTTLIESQQTLLREWLDQLQKIATSPQEFNQRDEFTNILSHIRGAQLNQADALKVIAVRVTELTPASGAAVALGTPENMICLAASGVAPEVGTAVAQGTGLTGECILRRKMVYCQSAKNDPRVDRSFSFGSAVILPLLVSGEVRGVVEAFALQPNAFDADAIETLERLADAVIFTSYGVVPQRRLVSNKQGGGFAGGASSPSVSKSSTVGSMVSQNVSASSHVQPLADVPVTAAAGVTAKFSTLQPAGVAAKASMSASTMSSYASARAGKMEGSLSAESDVDLLGIEGLEGMEEAEENPQPSPFIAIPPYLKEEPARRESGKGKWFIVAACVIAVAGGLGWRFVLNSRHESTAPATAQVASQNTAVSEPASAPATPQNVTTPAPSSAQPNLLSSQPATTPKVDLGAIVPSAKTPTPTTPKQEKKPEVAKAQEAQPLLLSPSTGKVPRHEEEDASEAPISIPAEGSIAQISLPSTSSMPKLKAETPSVRTGGTLLHRVEPVYPGMARTAGLQGIVELQFRIMKDGSVGDIRRVNGQSVLANAAIEAVKQWRYDPVKINGEAVEVNSSVRLNFTLTH